MQTGDIYLYNYGSGIYNVDGLAPKFRQDVILTCQIKFDASEIYDNSNNKIPITLHGLQFIYSKNQPHVPILFPDGKYFKSCNSLNKYYKTNNFPIWKIR